MSFNRYRDALKKILEIRARERSIRVSRSIDDSRRIGLLARLYFEDMYEVLVWKKEERVLRVKKKF